MLFSVLATVYNTAPYLDACVQSVLSQTESDFELLLVDDGSTDGSGALCDRAAERDRRVRVLHTANRGVFLARAAAESHARGEYLLHIDADDTLAPDLLASLRENIERYHPDLLFYDYSLSFADGTQKSETFFPEDAVFAGDDLRSLCRLLLTTRFNTLCNKCFHRRLTDCAPAYLHYPRLRHGEDLLRSAYLVTGAENAVYLHRPFYYYRMDVGSSRAFQPETLENYAVLTERIRALLQKKVAWDDGWEAQLGVMCRCQLLNFIRSMASARVPLRESERLLRKSADTPFFRRALAYAPDTLPFRLLRKGRYGAAAALYRLRLAFKF